MATEAERRAKKKYQERNIIQTNVQVSRLADPELYDYLANLEESRSGAFRAALKRCIEEDANTEQPTDRTQPNTHIHE